MIRDKRLLELYDLYHKGNASAAETDELMHLLENLSDEQIGQLLSEAWKQQDANGVFFSSDVHAKLLDGLHTFDNEDVPVRSIGSKTRTLLFRMAAAAAVILVLSLTAFFLLNKKPATDVAQAQKQPVIVNDIAPGGDKAILTLADGRKIILDTANNGALTEEGGIRVIKIGGQVTYNETADVKGETKVLYNTITTPRGGQYQLELADGSKVWLNAASSLRFPTAFVGKERIVELTGEGYFEVATSPQPSPKGEGVKRPFKVRINTPSGNGGEVEVLGTHFNINAYSDEPAIKTTLIEGSVQVSNSGSSKIIKPGQQAQMSNSSSADGGIAVQTVDVDEVVAWKNGKFAFSSADVYTIMRQASRWYDVQVVYEKQTDETFSGRLPRSENISQLLKIMEATGKVKFQIRGKEIIVKPI